MLNYAHTYSNTKMSYYSSNLILQIESFATYLVMPWSLIHIYGQYYLIEHATYPTNPSDLKTNGPIITEYKTSWHVFGSPEEDEKQGLFING